MPRIIVREPGRVPTTLPLTDGFRVGRGDDNDLCLSDSKVSRNHAVFRKSERGFVVRDLGSKHGLFVNSQPTTEADLRDGDRVQLGDVVLVFCIDDQSANVVHSRATLTGDVQLALGKDARRLRLIYELSRSVGAIDDLDRLLASLLAAAVDLLECDRGLIQAQTSPRTLRRQQVGSTGDIVVSRAILDRVKTGEGVLIACDTGVTPATMIEHKVRSAMAAPLMGADHAAIGFVYVDDQGRADRFSEEDLDFLMALAHLTAASVRGADRFRRAAVAAELLRESQGGDMLGDSEPMRRLVKETALYAAAETNVLICGESGTGKELVAQRLHALSSRRESPMVTLNCAALPETMLDSELFGHKRGAFTGAVSDKRGRFSMADGGTLFLDEIGDLSASAQAKLLRAIEMGEILPVGSEKVEQVDVRVVSASHKRLADEVSAGRFREDLYYRLNVVEIQVPPLRDRGDDVVQLAKTFLHRAASRQGRSIDGLSDEALDALRAYAWPGNVRELINEIERAVVICDQAVVHVHDLSPRILSTAGGETGTDPSRQTLAQRFDGLEISERELVREAYRRAGGNVSEAARLLGVSRIMFKRRLDRFGIE